ncbi:MAG: glyceraldehyde-3-phosphate dehydrogenase, partial [Gammaproteobacteria bacterium]|nr:glyceraldehyde-3-phosphate dehydrogenase [Gammaproteobacteria bacterium]
RSILNNIILTTTGAANALKLVLPERGEIGFMAESVRIPTATGSLIILTLNIQAEDPSKPVNREEINAIYQAAAEGSMNDYLIYSEHQNVSSDIVGFPKAAATIESSETHSRTAMVRMYPADGGDLMEAPVTKVVIYGWYDNELGSYTNMLGDRLVSIAEQML